MKIENFKIDDKVKIHPESWFKITCKKEGGYYKYGDGYSVFNIRSMNKIFDSVVTIKSINKYESTGNYEYTTVECSDYVIEDWMIEKKVEDVIKPKYKVGDIVIIKELETSSPSRVKIGDTYKIIGLSNTGVFLCEKDNFYFRFWIGKDKVKKHKEWEDLYGKLGIPRSFLDPYKSYTYDGKSDLCGAVYKVWKQCDNFEKTANLIKVFGMNIQDASNVLSNALNINKEFSMIENLKVKSVEFIDNLDIARFKYAINKSKQNLGNAFSIEDIDGRVFFVKGNDMIELSEGKFTGEILPKIKKQIEGKKYSSIPHNLMVFLSQNALVKYISFEKDETDIGDLF